MDLLVVALALVALIGGVISLFAGRRFYPLWLGLAAYFFTSRILGLALFRLPEPLHDWIALLIGLSVFALVLLLRARIIRFVPTVGGFIVGTLLSEHLLALIHPESGKFLFTVSLLGGGLLGLYLFRKIVDFDDAIIILSALWGAAFFSGIVADILDVFLITAVGAADVPLAGFLQETQLLHSLLWLVLAGIGIFVQHKLVGYKPLPAPLTAKPDSTATTPPLRRFPQRTIAGVLGGLLLVFLLVSVAGANGRLSRSIRSSLTDLEHALGLAAEAPGDAPWQWATTLLRPELELDAGDRILVLVPHPDDDILSTAGTIQHALDRGLPLRVVFFTNGDYNETSFALYRKEITLDPVQALRLGETRREEALAALALLGVAPGQVVFLGYPDGGGLEIFERHWGEQPPYRGLLSGQSAVPYTFAQTPGAPYTGESITSDLQQLLREFRPTKIFTSHPGDVHPDHQSLPLYLQAALWDLEREVEAEVYHFITHYGRWPLPRGYQPEHPLEPPAQYDLGNRWRTVPLSDEQRQMKLAALQAHETQWGFGQAYMESLVRANEIFDVLAEVSLDDGQVVEVLPAETGVRGEALYLHPEQHRDAFVETEIRTVSRSGDELIFSIHFQEPLDAVVSAKVWAVAQRSDTSFAEMPKLFMDLSADGYELFDHGQALPSDAITVVSTPLRSEVRIPLALLDKPERAMVSAQTHLDDVPLDNIPWIFLNLSPEDAQ